MNKQINTALIGFGLSGRVFHAPFIHTHPGFHLTAVVERNREDSKRIYPYTEVIKDYKEVLSRKDIDLVVVGTPNTLHFPMVKEALQAGKDVIVEKPFVPTSREAEQLIQIAEKSGKKIFVYQNRRWDGDFLTIRKLIEQGSLGAIKYYEAHFNRYSPELKPGAWRDLDIPGGGILFDLGSHLIDQAVCLFGMPDIVTAEVKAERQGSKVDDYFRLELIYPDKSALLTAGMLVSEKGPRFIIDGTEGSFSKWGIDPQEASLKKGNMPVGEEWGKDDPKYYGTLGKGSAVPVELSQVPTEAGNYMAFYDNVYEVLFKNLPQLIHPQQARDVIFIIEKAFESSESGRTAIIR
jgi:predicted dehydrogenase